jgi:hypothetical protein
MSQRIPGGSVTYLRVSAVMEKYVSKIMVRSVLARALEEHRIAPNAMRPGDAKMVIEHAMVSLRLFCAPERLSEVMLELAELCHELEHER